MPRFLSTMSLISLEGASKRYNERVLLEGVDLAIGEGERVGLLGPNGGGKSTLLRILAGSEPPDSGTRVVQRGLRLGYLEQDPDLPTGISVRDAVRAGLGDRARVLADLERVHQDLANPQDGQLDRTLARQARLEQELERLGGYDVEHRVESTLLSLGLREFEAPCGQLSGGERRRVALAKLLLAAPDLLLLDEPTNHLDAFVTEWLEDWFLETKTPLLLVTHDRYFLDRVVDRIVELDRGELVSYPGGYHDYLEGRTARLESERKTESSRLNLLRRETAWMRRGAPARSTKAKARISRYEQLADSAPADLPVELVFEIPPGPRLGTRVLEVRGVSKAYGGRVVVPRMDLELEAGTRLGVVGPNGAGKTTLWRILRGELEPDSGVREVGETVRFMSVDQLRADLELDRTVAEAIVGRADVVRVGDRTVRAESFLTKWGFPARMHDTPIHRLSGGERARVLLAQLMCDGGNVLFLDEPTNDLDLATLRALEEALIAFPGTVVVVSHDRWFLDRVATRILYLDGEGGARLHHGDMSGLLEQLARERAGGESTAAGRERSGSGKASPEAPARQAKQRRISPWEQRELDELEERIGVVEQLLGQVDERLVDPALYEGDRKAAESLQQERAQLGVELQALYARWEVLEALRGP